MIGMIIGRPFVFICNKLGFRGGCIFISRGSPIHSWKYWVPPLLRVVGRDVAKKLSNVLNSKPQVIPKITKNAPQKNIPKWNPNQGNSIKFYLESHSRDQVLFQIYIPNLFRYTLDVHEVAEFIRRHTVPDVIGSTKVMKELLSFQTFVASLAFTTATCRLARGSFCL